MLPYANQMLQRLALEILHHDKWLPFVLTNVVNSANVRMIESGGGARLALEALEGLRVVL